MGQFTIPTKIKKKSVNVIESCKFGSDASLLVEEYSIYKELGLEQEDVTDFWVIVGCQMSIFMLQVFCSRNSILPTQCNLTFIMME